MLFLQTGDWHLGKYFYEHSLLEDQECFLNQIVDELIRASKNDDSYDALIVPGDIYDRAVPPAEAVTLFSKFLSRVHSLFPQLKMFFLAGNHDSASRLSFASELLNSQNIFFCTDTKNIAEPALVGNENNKVAVYQLPFLTPGSIASDNSDKILQSQQQLYEKALSIIKENHKKNYGALPSVVCAHLFTCGASVTDSERSFVGTAEQVGNEVFDGITYAAIGHIHKAQHFKDGKVQYSGAPLAYSFGENEDKCMLRVEIKSDFSVDVTKIPVIPLHRVVRLIGTYDEFYKPVLNGTVKDELKNAYIEIQCTDSLVHENAMKILSTGYPHLLSFTRKINVSKENESILSERKKVLAGSNKDVGAVFDLFMKDIYGTLLSSADISETELVAKEKKLFVDLSKDEK